MQDKLVTDSYFTINGDTYILECQSTRDGRMIIRIFGYAIQVALENADFFSNDTLEITLRKIPDALRAQYLWINAVFFEDFTHRFTAFTKFILVIPDTKLLAAGYFSPRFRNSKKVKKSKKFKNIRIYVQPYKVFIFRVYFLGGE